MVFGGCVSCHGVTVTERSFFQQFSWVPVLSNQRICVLSSQMVGSRIVEALINSPLSRAVALGKRKASEAVASSSKTTQDLSLAEDLEDESDFHSGDSGDEENEFDDVSVVGTSPPDSVTPTKRLYPCIWEDCSKVYTKPTRLAEHVRSHTGERPYVCRTCGKSYLRDSHLQAHARSHLPASARPHACSEEGCNKRFWTTQHLGVHVARVHHGEKIFACTEEGCKEAYAKHNQLKRHFAEKHCPPGTKPFRCEVDGCTKSFATTQHLRLHSKVHQPNRYACVDAKCATGSSSSLYFPTWSTLQAHLRECHPPACPYSECNGRVFTTRAGLKEHLKTHEQRKIEETLQHEVMGENRPTKRRRGGEVGRDWACEEPGCSKTFKSKKAVMNHHNITHLGRRDHVCAHKGCGATFGYRHLLQRHTAKVHPTSVVVATVESASEAEGGEPISVEWLTGKDYISPSTHNNTRRALLPCPWPWADGFGHTDVEDGQRKDREARCAYVFSRAYDLRRHLRAEHELTLGKEEVDSWARDWREQHSAEEI